jgi:hypothetical protein
MTGASRGHITNFKQSILETFDIYGFNSATLYTPMDNFIKHFFVFKYNEVFIKIFLNSKDSKSVLFSILVVVELLSIL